MNWLHDKGYNYHGDAPISGLTNAELTLLQLGHVVSIEQEQEQQRAQQQGHSSQSKSYGKRKQELINKYRN